MKKLIIAVLAVGVVLGGSCLANAGMKCTKEPWGDTTCTTNDGTTYTGTKEPWGDIVCD